MTSLVPTSRERLFLRAIAAPNPARPPGEDDWWSAGDLRTTALFPDFRGAGVMSLAGFGKSCARKGMTERRHTGPAGRGWTEWRITSFGRGLVADSCIGGGLEWSVLGGTRRCPACLTIAAGMGAIAPYGQEIPAHPLPGYPPPDTIPGRCARGDHSLCLVPDETRGCPGFVTAGDLS